MSEDTSAAPVNYIRHIMSAHFSVKVKWQTGEIIPGKHCLSQSTNQLFKYPLSNQLYQPVTGMGGGRSCSEALSRDTSLVFPRTCFSLSSYLLPGLLLLGLVNCNWVGRGRPVRMEVANQAKKCCRSNLDREEWSSDVFRSIDS